MNTLRKSSFVRAAAFLLLFVALIVVFGARPQTTEAGTDPIDITLLAIGDSITEGYNANLGSPKSQASYRLPLKFLLETYSKTSFKYTFVGPNTNGSYADGYPITVTGDVKVLDIKHFGWSGANTITIYNNFLGQNNTTLNSWENSNQVVVLIQAGTNDVKEGKPKDKTEEAWIKDWINNIEKLLTYLKEKRNANGTMTVFIANIIPVNNPDEDGDGNPKCEPEKIPDPDNPSVMIVNPNQNFAVKKATECANLKNKNINKFNKALEVWCNPTYKSEPRYHSGLCDKTKAPFNTLGIDVYFVDQWSFASDYNETLVKVLSDGKDNIHPNIRGEGLIALRWYWALLDASLADPLSTDDFCKTWFGTGMKGPCIIHPTPFEGPCEQAPGNMVANCGFSSGRGPWRFYTNGKGRFSVTSLTSYTGATAARVKIVEPGKNVQFYQTGFYLQPNSSYELSFAAYSSDGRDMRVFMHKHGEPYTNYGLGSTVVDLGTNWQLYTITFTTPNREYMNDARLRFWFAPFAVKDTTYFIDEVELVKLP